LRVDPVQSFTPDPQQVLDPLVERGSAGAENPATEETHGLVWDLAELQTAQVNVSNLDLQTAQVDVSNLPHLDTTQPITSNPSANRSSCVRRPPAHLEDYVCYNTKSKDPFSIAH